MGVLLAPTLAVSMTTERKASRAFAFLAKGVAVFRNSACGEEVSVPAASGIASAPSVRSASSIIVGPGSLRLLNYTMGERGANGRLEV